MYKYKVCYQDKCITRSISLATLCISKPNVLEDTHKSVPGYRLLPCPLQPCPENLTDKVLRITPNGIDDISTVVIEQQDTKIMVVVSNFLCQINFRVSHWERNEIH